MEPFTCTLQHGKYYLNVALIYAAMKWRECPILIFTRKAINKNVTTANKKRVK